MFNTILFYKVYEKLFMNNFLDLILDNYIKGKIKFSNNKLIVFDVGAYKGTFSRYFNEKFKYENKKINFYLFDPCIKFVNLKKKLKGFEYFDLALGSSKPGIKKFYLNNFLHASGKLKNS